MIEPEQNDLEQLEVLQLFSTAQNENELADLIDKQYPNLSVITDTSREEFIAQFLPYIGGKYKQSRFIQSNLPAQHFKTYISIFGGMMWDFLRLDPNNYTVDKVVYNDINPLNVNLFRCLINQRYMKFYEVVKDIPNRDPERFKSYQNEIFDPSLILDETPNFDIAMKYAYVLTNIFSGLAPAKAIFVGGKKTGFDTLKKKLDISNLKYVALRANLDKITEVVKLDFADAISQYDSKDTFLFVDPPYINTEDYYSNSTFNKSDHERLAKSLKTAAGKFQLCYYADELLHELYPQPEFNWQQEPYAVVSSSKTEKNMKMELIVMNYGIKQLRDEKMQNIFNEKGVL